MYDSIYQLISTIAFDGVLTSSSPEAQVVSFFALALTLGVFFLPFFCVYKFIAGIMEGFK